MERRLALQETTRLESALETFPPNRMEKLPPLGEDVTSMSPLAFTLFVRCRGSSWSDLCPEWFCKVLVDGGDGERQNGAHK